jgi:Ca2+/Na+ antiporter
MFSGMRWDNADMRRIAIIMVVNLVGILGMTASILTHHFRLPAIIFVILLGINFFILKMKRPESEVAALRTRGQAKTVKALRRAGYFYAGALILGLCVADYKSGPWWAHVIGISISTLFIYYFFSRAKKISDMSPNEWEQRLR